MEGKECKDHERLKMCMRKSMPKRGSCISMAPTTFSEPVAVDEKRFVAAARNSAGEKGEQKQNETPQGTWLGGVRTGSLWLCYARPLAGKQKSEI